MSALMLKIIACAAMLTDHIGYSLKAVLPYRLIGRIAFPLYTFQISEGYKHTRNVFLYELRLFAFALISEIPFNLFTRRVYFYPQSKNVFFTLFISLLAIHLTDIIWKKSKISSFTFKTFLSALILYISCLTAYSFRFEYGYIGVLLTFSFYIFDYKTQKNKLFIAVLIISALPVAEALVLGTVPSNWTFAKALMFFALIPIFLYNGKSGLSAQGVGKKAIRYAFYIFYPLHLSILFLLLRFNII